MSAPPRIVAFGRSRMFLRSIEGVAAAGFSLAGIVTDVPYAEYDVVESDFEALAHKLSVPFYRVSDLTSLPDEALFADYAISVNWRRRVSARTLGLFAKGPLNFHLGNLPDFKGNATIQWAMLCGASHIQADVHRMVPELDAGDVVVRAPIAITDECYVADILHEAERLAPRLFVEAIMELEKDPRHCIVPGSTEGLRCYPRIEDDYRIDWRQPAEQIARLVRCSSRPYPGAYSYLDERRVVFWRARARQPSFSFLAVPGHVVAYDTTSGQITVACGEGFLDVSEIGLPAEQRVSLVPTEVVRSIRVRFRNERPLA